MSFGQDFENELNDDDNNDETFGSAVLGPTIGSLEEMANLTQDIGQKDMPLFTMDTDNSQELNLLELSMKKIPHSSDAEQ